MFFLHTQYKYNSFIHSLAQILLKTSEKFVCFAILFCQDINPVENDQTMRYRKKIEKDENYVNTALRLCSVSIK